MYDLHAIDALPKHLSGMLIATQPVRSVSPEASCAELWDWMQPAAEDISTVLVNDSEQLLYAARSSAWATCSDPVGEMASPVPVESIVDPRAPLSSIIEVLRDRSFCLFGTAPDAIATTADLAKPASALWAFSLLLSLEDALGKLVPSLSHGLWLESLDRKAQRRITREVEKRRASGTFLTREACLTLNDRAHLGGIFVAPILGWDQTQWEDEMEALRHLRNDLAHGRPLGASSGGMREALEHLDTLREVVSAAWALVDERPQVWEAYRQTQLELDAPVDAETYWMLSAQNPWDEPLPPEENDARHRALVAALSRRGLFGGEGSGSSSAGEGAWSERMAVLVGGSDIIARQLSEQFGQRSVFKIERGVLKVLEVATGQVRGQRDL